jgi:hypothetical protein
MREIRAARLETPRDACVQGLAQLRRTTMSTVLFRMAPDTVQKHSRSSLIAKGFAKLDFE